MGVARLIARLPKKLQAPACLLLIGHVYRLKFEGDRMFLACDVCPHESVGMTIPPERHSRYLPGDPRRFESYARRVA